MGFVLRDAVKGDCKAISDIYNHYVAGTTCTLATQEETLPQREAWFSAHGPSHPVLVVEEAGVVLGWAAVSTFNTRCGYRTTVEDSIYLRHDQRGRGLGRALLQELLRRSRAQGHHTVIAKISAEQDASVALHAAAGFKHAGRLRDVGFKFNRWIDVIYMQCMLEPAQT